MTAQLPEVNKNSTLYGQDYWKCDHPSPIQKGGYQELLDKRGKLWEYHQMQYELDEAGSN